MSTYYLKNIKTFNSYADKISSSFLDILCLNIRSVSSISKFNKFKYELSKFSKLPDIIAVQETWISMSLASLYFIPGYEVVHCCRKDGYGGTSIFIKAGLKYSVRISNSEEFLDTVSIELQDIKIMNKCLIITSLYRSQKCSIENFFRKVDNMLISLNDAPCFFVGDFNIDTLSANRYQSSLINIFSEYNVNSCHNLITRPQSGTSIDCIFSNVADRTYVYSIENNLSDHNMICCRLENELLDQCFLSEKFSLVNYEQLGTHLDGIFRNICLLDTSSELCKNLMNGFIEATEHCTTTTTRRLNLRRKLTPWMTDNLLSLIFYKKYLLAIRRKNRGNADVSERLKRISKIVKICNKDLMNQYYINSLKSCLGDPGKTWRFLNREFGRKNRVLKNIVTEDGCVLTTDEEKASTINDYFYGVVDRIRREHCVTQTNFNFLRTLTAQRTSFSLQMVERTAVECILSNFNISKSPGFDNITPRILQIRKNAVVGFLTEIFNKMVNEGCYPDVLKLHKIIPIPKVSASNRICNLRPISLLSIIDKVFEKIIFDQVSNYLDSNGLLFERQFGFRKGAGTEQAVLNLIDHICEGLDAGYRGVAGVFFDFSKAFDLVDHDILINKLRLYGFDGKTLDLFRDFLSNRLQFVQVGDAKSTKLPVKCGVPQGSVLGPLLFLIYINDVKNISFNGKLFMYADDLCLVYRYNYSQVLKTNIEYDAAILTEFSEINKLKINPAKTTFVRFKPYHCGNDEKMEIYIEGIPVAESDMVKYLGIVLNHNMLWDEHIESLKSKISSAIGVLYKFRNKFNISTKLLIYQSLVHSHLTYLPSVYGCRLSSSLRSLQSAQNKALKLVFNLPLRHSTFDLYNNYAKNILPVIGLYKQKVLIYMFKALKTNSHCLIQFSQNIAQSQRNTRQAQHLRSVRCRLELTKQRISYAGPHEYNNLPSYLRDIQVLSTFKQQIKNYLLENLETLLM